VWALFVDPQHEGKGIGRILLQRLVARSTERGLSQISLTTTPGTRAEAFYERQGWKAAEIEANGEIRMNLALKLSGVNGEKAEI
jgi:GNAT superfamily N-acetyltransferase